MLEQIVIEINSKNWRLCCNIKTESSVDKLLSPLKVDKVRVMDNYFQEKKRSTWQKDFVHIFVKFIQNLTVYLSWLFTGWI